MSNRFSVLVPYLAVVSLLLCSSPAASQDPADEFAALGLREGPTVGDLGFASIDVPAGFQFVGRGGASKFMELMQNPSDGDELGVLLRSEGDGFWFVVFSFSPEGYVQDDESDLDAEAILSSMREGTEQANKVRLERGWSSLNLLGWQQPPFYDSRTNNLTWSIRAASDGEAIINHFTKLLGRRGVMSANLVISPEQMGNALPAFDNLLTGFSFNAGERYAEFRQGDKVAKYGLTGLIVGGTGVALVKSGLLQKFWKLIVIGLIALAGGIKRLVSGRSSQEQANV